MNHQCHPHFLWNCPILQGVLRAMNHGFPKESRILLMSYISSSWEICLGWLKAPTIWQWRTTQLLEIWGFFFLSFFLFSFLLLQKCHPLMPRYVCCLSKVQGWSLLLYYNSNKNKRIWKEGMVGVEWRRRYSIKNEKVLQFCHSFFCIFLLIFVQHKNATFFLKTLFKAILY